MNCKRTHEIGQHVDCVGEIQTEYDSLRFVWRTTAFALVEFGIQVIASEDAAQYAAQPRLHNVKTVLEEAR